MRIRKKPWAKKELAGSSIYLSEPLRHAGSLASLFSREAPLILELGCGKGFFLAEQAPARPDSNFIGIDIKSDILAVAHRNISAAYLKRGIARKNILLLPFDITRIGALFFEKTMFDAVYIHFPNPWPKERHKKRRLTHPRQLMQYRDFLKNDAPLFFKTDDSALYRDTLNSLSVCGYSMIYTTEDYYRDVPENEQYPPTEHEVLFHGEGKPIFYIEAQKREVE